MTSSLIYLDNNATTKVDPRVVEKMLPYFTERYGNASSISHPLGWSAKQALDDAREHIAALIHASPDEILFTSGATESNNIVLFAHARRNASFVSTPVEHSSILNPLAELTARGSHVRLLPVDRLGKVSVGSLDTGDQSGTLVSVILANNEIGTIQNMTSISGYCRDKGFLLHTDATQALGKIPVDVDELGVDFLSLSAHKFHGPKGVGTLYVRKGKGRRPLPAHSFGGGQERGIRPGTENVPAIVGMGEAARLCLEDSSSQQEHLILLRDFLQKNIVEKLEGVTVNGDLERRLPNTLSLTFRGVDAEDLLMKVPEICLSTGSACESGSGKSSHVLQALGMTDEEAHGTIRLAVSRFTTLDEVQRASNQIVQAVQSIRNYRF